MANCQQSYRIDLRSDTVTVPTEEMRAAMAAAEVGDDVYGNDPTVNRLEEVAAAIMGKESALFVPSGTMGNQIALFSHIQRGQEVILSEDCHIVQHECGGAAILSGANLRCLPANRDGNPGQMEPEQVEKTIRKELNIHTPSTGLICLENAHSSGTVHPLTYMEAILRIAKTHGIPVHLDGARIFNASAYLNVSAAEIARYADSVMFCLSKGLCAPVGSILTGSREFILRARRCRKILGGGMRQAGILAAAGLIALERMTLRISEDHSRACRLAAMLLEIPGVKLHIPDIHINMIYLDISAAGFTGIMLAKGLEAAGILINGDHGHVIRLVTHFWILEQDLPRIAGSMRKILEGKVPPG